MTNSDSIRLPEKAVQFCAVTGDFEVQVNGQVMSYAATELCGTQLANEYVYAVLSTRCHLYADLAQDDADALLALHLTDTSIPRDSAPNADSTILSPIHHIYQLIHEAARLVSHPACAA